MCDFYMGGYKVIVQFKGLVTSRSGCCDNKFGKLGMGWVFLVQTSKKTDRQTNRQTNRETGTQAGRQTIRQTVTDRQTDRRQIDRGNDSKRCRQTDGKKDRQGQTIRQAGKKTI